MRDRRHWLVAILMLAAAVRFATLDTQSFWADEAATVHLLRESFADMLSGIAHGESTPPLYYVLAWPWAKLFGTGEVGLRSLSALIGTISVLLVYLIGARIASTRAALIAAALTAVSPLLVWYSQEARSYALLVLLGALSLLALLRALERPSAARLGIWALAAALALASHYFAIFVVLPEAVWLTLTLRRRALLPLAGVALAGAALLPLALHQRSRHGAAFIEHSARLERIAQVPKQFLVGFDAPAETILTIAAAVLAAIGLLLALGAARERDGLLRFVLLAAAALAIPIVLALAGEDYLITRNVIAAWVPLTVIVAAGLGRGGALGLATGAALCAIGLAIVIAVAAKPEYQRDDWRGAAQALGPARTERAIVVTPASGARALELYLRGARPETESTSVDEVDLVAIAAHTPGHARRAPRLPTAPLPSDFVGFARKRAPTFTVVRFAEPSRAGSVAMYAPLDNGAEVLVQPPQ